MNRRLKLLLGVYLACMAVMHIFILFYFSDFTLKGYNDFAAFYTAGTIVKEGKSAELYDPALQWKVQSQFAPEVEIRKGPLPYIHPPFEAWLFWPFAHLAFAKAYIVWTIFKFVLLVTAIFLLLPSVNHKIFCAFLLGILSLGLFPVAVDLLQGQDSILLLLVFSGCFFLLLRNRDFWSGCVLALGLFKFHLILPVALVLLLRKKNRFALGFGAGGVLLFLVSILMVGWNGVLQYPKYVWVLDHAPGLGVTTWENMPNIRGILTSIFGQWSMVNLLPWIVLPITVAGVIFAALVWEENENRLSPNFAAGFSLAIVMSLLTSYYVYSYEMTLLLIPVLVLGTFVLSETKPVTKTIFVLATVMFFFSPAGWYMVLRTQWFCWYGSFVLLLFVIALVGIMRREQTQLQTATIQRFFEPE